MHNRNRKACKYCGCETDISTNKCQNCGSAKFESLAQAAKHHDVPYPYQQQAAASPYPAQAGSGVKNPAHKKAATIGLVVGVFAVFIIVAVVLTNVLGGGVSTSTHHINSLITTDWFRMTVYEGKIIRTKNSYCGLDAPSSGKERVLVDIKLNNYLYDENLDINIAEDFYLEAGSEKYPAKNTGGSYSVFDKLTTDGMFFGRFMVSPKKELHGYIAFDIPADVRNLRFVYEEYNFDGDERTTLKHYYKVDLEYDMPKIPSGPAQTFYDKAYDAGYVLEIINDYDGYETFWVGAHKYIDESSKGILKKPEPVYWVDCTKDKNEHNAKVEYRKYVDKVKANGGTVETSSGTVSGTSYQYQINEGPTKFGVAYQLGLFNYLVESAPIEYKTEIFDFFSSLSLKIS